MSQRHDTASAGAAQAHHDDRQWHALSGLMDGEAAPAELNELCDAWKRDPALRGRWHEWQLIGDVMRSDELAGAPLRDQAMLRALRERLAAEPVPLAPAALPPPAPEHSRRMRQWLSPVAAAAGFVAVAGVLVVTRVGMPEAAPSAGLQATAPAAQLPMAVRPVSGSASDAQPMLRDAGLDRYVSAHRKMPLGAEMPGRADPRVQFVRVEK